MLLIAIEVSPGEILSGEVMLALVRQDGSRDLTRPFLLRKAMTRRLFRCSNVNSEAIRELSR